MKIKKYILIVILVAGTTFPLFAKAAWIDDVFKAIALEEMIPNNSCIRSVDGNIEGSSQRGEDERGLMPGGLTDLLTGDHNRCSSDQICRTTGSGQIDGNIDNETRYDLSVEWGTCTSADSGGSGGVIGNLRQGLNDLRGIFPSRLQSERGIVNTIGALIRWVLGIAGSIFVAMVVYGGIQYLIVGTNEKNVEKAKTTITYAVIGIVIIAGAWLIADFVISALIRGA